jgi:chemotaxis family two-component system response regulator Rcp1
MNQEAKPKLADILLVEDNPGDVRLAKEAFKECKLLNKLYQVEDGIEAMAFLRQEGKYSDAPRPDLVLLDLNLPRKDGREVLVEIKNDQDLKIIPIIVLTTSHSDKDILQSYQLNANCYITKPVDFTQFIDVVKSIEKFWLTVVTLPQKI